MFGDGQPSPNRSPASSPEGTRASTRSALFDEQPGCLIAPEMFIEKSLPHLVWREQTISLKFQLLSISFTSVRFGKRLYTHGPVSDLDAQEISQIFLFRLRARIDSDIHCPALVLDAEWGGHSLCRDLCRNSRIPTGGPASRVMLLGHK